MIGRLGKAFLWGAVLTYLLIYLAFFLSGSPLYFGEAVSFEGLLRLLKGLPFASLPDSIPLSLTPYTPLFLIPHWILGKLLSLHQFQDVLLLARIVQFILLLGLFFSLNFIRKRFLSDDSSFLAFLSACLLVFLYSPAMVLALRPDTVSFTCEIWAVFWMLRYLTSFQRKLLALCGIFFGLAVATKFNTLGGVAGSLLFLLFSKDWRGFLGLSLSFLLSFSLFLGIQWIYLGSSFDQNILLSIQSRLWSFSEALEIYKKVFDLFLIPLGFYFFLIILGLAQWKNRRQALYLIFVLMLSFAGAFLGQLKWGAFHNYFLGFLYLGILPASGALFYLSKKYQKVFLLFLVFWGTLWAIRGLSVPVKIWQEKRFFPEITKLQELVSEKAPEKWLYVNADAVGLAFVGKSAIGILSEELFFTTPKLSPYYPRAKEVVLKNGGIGAYITPCAYYPPAEWGFADSKKWNRIQTGRYCLFY